MARIANQRKIPKWLPFKNYKSESLDMHKWGTYVHMYTKYEVSMSNPVLEEVCTDDTNINANDNNAQWTICDCIRLFG